MQSSIPKISSERLVKGLKTVLTQQGILLAFIVFLLGVSLYSDNFLTSGNILRVLVQSSVIGLMALGVTFVVIGGNFDLSVGSLLSLTTILAVDLHDKVGPTAAILITVLVAFAVGCFNGFLVGFLKLNSLIVTLGMLSALQGATLIYSGGQNANINNPQGTYFSVFGRASVLGIPVPVIIFGTVALILGIFLARTSYGRRLYAVGGNRVASAFSGIRANIMVLSTFVISALATSAAAIILGSRVMGSQNNVGEGYELLVLAAVILGGTSLLGGSGSIFKTIIGVLIFGFIQNGLLLLGFPYYTQWLVTWFVIIAAVWLDMASRRGKVFAT